MNEQVTAADIARVEQELKEQREKVLDWFAIPLCTSPGWINASNRMKS